jgi:hypothetical protein
VGSFVRRVKTASGATAVQIVHKRGRQVVGIDHIGSAHDEDRLVLLLETAKQRLHADQQALELELTPPEPADPGAPVVEAAGSLILWDALAGLYDTLGFDAVDDEAFKALVLGRIIEPTSKLDTVRVLGELGVDSPTRVTFMRCLKRVLAKDYPRSRRPAIGTRPAAVGWRWCSTTSPPCTSRRPVKTGCARSA